MNLIPKNKIEFVITNSPFVIYFKTKKQTIVGLYLRCYLSIIKLNLKITMILHLDGLVKFLKF